ncbi:MAG: UMP kinase [Oscillospiraceae bacterium]|nr:UMP kinase [Oscillospiraceae bacterium]
MLKPRYRRILLKLSGEALSGEKDHGIDFPTVLNICKAINECCKLGVQIGIVVGGGNFLRGHTSSELDRTRADHMGMLATTINSLGIASMLEKLGVIVRVQTAVSMRQFAEPYIRNKALSHMTKGRVVVFACGTGNPFFSTDTAASLRAAEVDANIVLKATTVDGVYDSDPKLNKNAVKYQAVSFQDVLSKNLGFMDSTAASLCRDNKIPVLVFSIKEPNNIVRAVCEENIGTLVKN